MHIRLIEKKDNAQLAKIVRFNFELHNLAIPGTVYFDPELDDLFTLYNTHPGSKYYVLEDEDGTLNGGVGFSAFHGFPSCAELQKLYLSESVKGKGYGKKLFTFIEEKALESGYNKLYIETNSNFAVAIQMYQKMGYTEIPRPSTVQHAAMDRFFIKQFVNNKL